MKLLGKKIITGCEAHGNAGIPYLIRYTIIECRRFQVLLHKFVANDHTTELHDHPWPFVAVILWRGYVEHTATGSKRKRPGMILLRRAKWQHYVTRVDNKVAWSLVITGARVRTWGFVTKRGWMDWRAYFAERGC